MLRGDSPIKAALLSAAFLFAVLSACSTSGSFRDAREIAAWAGERGFAEAPIQAGAFRLTAFVRKPSIPSDTLAIYIEGDGAAWRTPYHPPRDPTPTKPVSLTLAAADPSAAVVYLGRPCQYLSADELERCDSAYWTERRFAPEVVAAYEAAINQQKAALAVRRLRLIGYSGGGVLATLLAARRDDVDVLVTVAAPLAVVEWVAWHDASQLKGSLDPAELGENVRLPHSVHFVGGKDVIVPPAIVESFVRRKGGRTETISGFDHECCWARDWTTLLQRTMAKESAK
ncbi:MAG: alpha/beta hydrolase [Rhodocyclaceae bacterium]|nr:MAG: alpha/beta hydrolase [Rhodocyclaceae bacterium]